MPDKHKTKEWIFRIVLCFCGIFLSLALAELYLRISSFKYKFSPRTVKINGREELWDVTINESDYKDGYVNYKFCYSSNYKGFFDKDNCVPTTLNSLGFRGPLFNFEKKADIFRIIFLGDSFIYGQGVFYEKTLVERLKHLLNNRTINGKQIEVFNLAVPDSSTEDEIADYIDFGSKLKPDLVIVQWNTNDFPSSKIYNDHFKFITGNYLEAFNPPKLIKWSALGRFLWHTIKTKLVSHQLMELTAFELELGKNNFQRLLYLKKQASADNSEFVLLIFPELIKFENYPYANLIDSLKKFCQENNIQTLDLLPSLSKYKDKDLWVHPSDHHPNNLAHEIAAMQIYNFLNENYFDD